MTDQTPNFLNKIFRVQNIISIILYKINYNDVGFFNNKLKYKNVKAKLIVTNENRQL